MFAIWMKQIMGDHCVVQFVFYVKSILTHDLPIELDVVSNERLIFVFKEQKSQVPEQERV